MKVKMSSPFLGTKGASLAEYGLLVGLIAVTATTAVASQGAKVSTIFADVSYAISKKEAVVASPREGNSMPDPMLTTPQPIEITVGVSDINPDIMGYASPDNSANPFGIISGGSPSSIEILSIAQDTLNDVTFLVARGDTTDILAGKWMNCDDGNLIYFDDADTRSYDAATGATLYQFDAHSWSITPGSTVNCIIS
ncbi:Flp family type IVb pilin [Loktanella sp. DJP18]|uniref:Flp family type IVb pilin n=1 Tax=Loktanella sp. DJP18 TaxID=3409788 RepID=UPI003BB54C20